MRRTKKKNSTDWKSFFAALAIVALVIVLPLLILVSTKRTNQNEKAQASSQTDLYGIAAGDVLPWMSDAELTSYFDDIKSMGAKWIRFDFNWADMQYDGPAQYKWANYDRIVTAANAHGIKVLGTIAYVPPWALPSDCSDMYHCRPKNVQDYATFANTIVAHYAPKGVKYWEIWNEPNGGAFTPAYYTELMKAGYPAIKSADPNAYVLAGGSMPSDTTGTKYSPIDFLTGIYANGGKGYFDGLAHHPYCWGAGLANCPSTYAYWSAWSQMADTNPSLRSVMVANGDSNKLIWATEYGAPTSGGTLAISEAQQAQVVRDAYTLFASYSWSGPMLWYQYKDKCTTATDTECFFGLLRSDGTHKAAYDTYKTMALNAGVTPTASPTATATPVPTATSIPTATNTPTPTKAPSIVVTSLGITGTIANKTSTAKFTLKTTGSLSVDRLLVAVRNASGVGYDFPSKDNVILSGTQSFTSTRTFPAGTYTYWVSYSKNGTWYNLSPINTLKIK